MASVPGFLTKTFEIFSSPEYADCCGWGPGGDTIIIRKIEQFSKNVLPKYFKHSNFQSFVRQLNMYDFHKTVQDPNHGEFQHQFFKEGRPELLMYIKRKANNRTESLKKFSRSSAAQEADYAMEEGLEEFDGTYTGGEVARPLSSSSSMPGLEARLSKVEEENKLLKKMFLESHQKNLYMQERMERVLKTLYSVFVGPSGGGRALSLSSRMPSLLLTDSPYSKQLLLDDIQREPSLELPPIDLPPNDLLSPPFQPPLQGVELSSSTRGSSFDFAAASVSAPPLKYLPSFDSSLQSNALPASSLLSYPSLSDPLDLSLGLPLHRRGSVMGMGLGLGIAEESDRVVLLGEGEGDRGERSEGAREERRENLVHSNNNSNNIDHSDGGRRGDSSKILTVVIPSPATINGSNNHQGSIGNNNSNYSNTDHHHISTYSNSNDHPEEEAAGTAPTTNTSNNNTNSNGSETLRWNLRHRNNGKRKSFSSYNTEEYIVPISTPTLRSSNSLNVFTPGNKKMRQSSVDGMNNNNNNNSSKSLSSLLQAEHGKELGISEQELSQVEAHEFIDLLNRNQNTTLNRLDSLEQTIATLLNTMDGPSSLDGNLDASADAAASHPLNKEAAGDVEEAMLGNGEEVVAAD